MLASATEKYFQRCQAGFDLFSFHEEAESRAGGRGLEGRRGESTHVDPKEREVGW